MGIGDWLVFVKERLIKFSNLINNEIGKSRIEKRDISFLSQNFGLKKIINNYLYIFF
tara:strand:+ start:94 stop:264 length:171 start_codon:yes stop_codon:yes gene_type:complete